MALDKIKLIWDFRGRQAEGTAKHHAIHLAQFSAKEEIVSYGHGHELMSESHCIAYLIVERKDMITVRDALLPHRAVLVE